MKKSCHSNVTLKTAKKDLLIKVTSKFIFEIIMASSHTNANFAKRNLTQLEIEMIIKEDIRKLGNLY
jgi:hypothetical protein